MMNEVVLKHLAPFLSTLLKKREKNKRSTMSIRGPLSVGKLCPC